MSTPLSAMSQEELQGELHKQREIVQALDLMVLGQIITYLNLRTDHVLRIFAVKKLLGIRRIRDKSIEDSKLVKLEAETKRRGFPRPMLSSFFRSVFRYARWVQAEKEKE